MQRGELLKLWKERQNKTDNRADDDGQWITTENGHHIHLNENGTPDKGNPHVIAAIGGKQGDKPKKAKGTMSNEDIRNNILHEVMNKTEGKGSASSALADLRKNDTVTLKAKTYKGNQYETTVKSLGDGTFEVSNINKGIKEKPIKMSLEDATSEVLYFKSKTGGRVGSIDISRNA